MREDAGRRWPWLVWVLRGLVVLAIIGVIGWVATQIDWAQVGDAFSNLSIYAVVALVVLVTVRYVFSAAPLSMFVPNLGLARAAVSDLTAVAMATAAPPPGDLVVRFAMFRSWGIDMARGAAGLSLNTVLFYVIRFAAPVFGVVALVLGNRFDTGLGALPYLSGALAAAIAVGIAMIARSDRGAAWVGRTAGRIVQRLRPDRANPNEWADRMREFRGNVAEDLGRRWWQASIALVAMLMTEAIMFVVAVRAAGVPAEAASGLVVAGAFCLVYPATSLPAAGLGVLDAALFGLLNAETGGAYEAELTAALVIWRSLTTILPVVVGGLTLLMVRRSSPRPEAT